MHGGTPRPSLDRLRAEVALFRAEDRDGWTGFARTSRAEELIGILRELDAACIAAVRDANRDKAWTAHGHSSVTDWLAHRAQISRPSAARYSRTAKHLSQFDKTAEAFDAHELGAEQLDRLARVARRREKLYAEQEDMLLGQAAEHDLSDFTAITEQWRLYADDHLTPVEVSDCESTLDVRVGFGGWRVLEGTFEPALGAAMERVLRDRMGPPAADDTRSVAERRAQALADLLLGPVKRDAEPSVSDAAEAADPAPIDHDSYDTPAADPVADRTDSSDADETDMRPEPQDDPECGDDAPSLFPSMPAAPSPSMHTASAPRRGAPRVNVDVRVDIEVLTNPDQFDPDHCRAELDGRPIAPSEARMLCCDSWIGRILARGASQVIDVGRRSRTAPDALRRALVIRDGGCRFPGCTQAPERCDVHHPEQVSRGGETTFANTCLICPKHHRYVHRNWLFLGVDANGETILRPESPP